jgi:hypothetical protein
MDTIVNNGLKFTFIIPSYNRFDKLVNLINQINTYNNTSIIIFDDASTDKRYGDLVGMFNNLTITHNRKNNGKGLYNNTVVNLLNSVESTDFDYVVMLADDFILCDNFIPLLSGIVNEYNIINIFSIHESNWTFRGWIDGAFACSKNAIPIIKSNIKPIINSNNNGTSTGVWKSVTMYFWKNTTSNYKLVTLNYSLTQHDGNDDSKLHPIHRLRTPITARNFYNDYYGNEIKIIGESTMKQPVQKKNAIPNGKRKHSTPSNNNNIVEPYVEPKPILPIINSPIEHDKSKLDSIKESLNKQKQSRISKINNDVFMAKARKQNLRLGGR